MVAANGYTVLGSDPKLRVVPLKGPAHPTRPFHKYPGLFKQFAAVQPSADGVVEFANKFGLLQEGDHENHLALWLQHRSDFAELTATQPSNEATPSFESGVREDQSHPAKRYSGRDF